MDQTKRYAKGGVNVIKFALALGAAVALGACGDKQNDVAATSQGDASDLADFVGAKGGQAEGGLNQRGYSLVRTEGLTAYWYNPTNNTCAQIVTSDGRYSSITGVAPSLCGI